MALRLRNVVGTIVDGLGEPVDTGTISFVLKKPLGYSSTHVVVDRLFTTETASDGTFSIALWCDEDSILPIDYLVKFPVADNGDPQDAHIATISLAYETGDDKEIGELLGQSATPSDIASNASLVSLMDARIDAFIGGNNEVTDHKDASDGYVGLSLFAINFKNAANTFLSKLTNSNTAARLYTFPDRDGTILDNHDLAGLEATANKDASGGYVGKTLQKINFRNTANSFTSFLINAATAARNYTFPDRDGTIADDTDIAGRQPLNANLTTIAGLTATTNNFLVAVSSAWASRTPSQVLTTLGLDQVTNTSDANKPVSTAQQTALNLKANLASPALTGTPTAPTQSAGDNSTNIATTAYADNAVTVGVTGLLKFKSLVDCSGNPNYPSAIKGDSYMVSVAGKIGGASGTAVDIGDWYIATATNAGGTEASVGASWGHLEHNLVGALLTANNLSDLANAGTARTNLGLGIGVNVQAWDADLDALAGLTTGADKFPYFTGTSAASMLTIVSSIRTLLASADVSTFRTNAGLGIGVNVQAYNADLAAIAALSPSNDDFLQRKAGAWANRTVAQVKSDLLLTGTNSGDETTTTVGTLIHGATAKTTPIDADEIVLVDTAASNVAKKSSFTNIKAFLKTYFDTLYMVLGGSLGTPSDGTLSNCVGASIGAVLSSAFTNATATLANTALSATLVSGKAYSFRCYIIVSNSASGDGIQLDFNGGTATATTFSALGASNGIFGGYTASALSNLLQVASLPSTQVQLFTGEITVNAGGTFIVRAADNTHSTGTLTMAAGSHLVLTRLN